ncbi:MAG: protein translocase subunit SecF [Clostridia bacterium]|nr:protein translocase subunit SecF [Clostridia bacterium]
MFKNKSFHIVEKFKYFLIVALCVILIGGVFMIVNAASGRNVMNFGIDFTGGAVIEIDLGDFGRDQTNRNIIKEDLDSFIEGKGYKIDGSMQYSDSSDGGVTYEYRLRYQYKGTVVENESQFVKDINDVLCAEITDELARLFEENQTLVSANATLPENQEQLNQTVTAYSVSKSTADSLIVMAIIALLVAIVVMLIYIVIRFTASSALAAVCALVHDVLIMVALTTVVSTLFDMAVNQTFVAAVITIVGYSINATIIIFDRIREELKTSSASLKTDEEIANLAIKDTLNRTILTTITTLVMVLVLVFLSVQTIREFIIPIIFGLLAGAFSSVLLAPALWVNFRKIARNAKQKKDAKNGYATKSENK